MDRSDIFGEVDSIFSNKDLLEIGHLPESDRIVGREDEIMALGSVLKPALVGQSPTNALLYGKTGTGKSLTAEHVTRELVAGAAENDVDVAVAYVDCGESTTQTQAIKTIARELKPDDLDISVPLSGLSTADYYHRMWQVIEAVGDVAIVILDEVDRLPDDNVLLQLSRATEAGKVETTKVGVVGISNKIRFKDQIGERVKSSLCEREFIFDPYDANQLRAIMEARKDAFQDGVLDDDTIPLAAAYAAKEHGDARKAIDILRYAGEIADAEGSDVVGRDHVDEAREMAERNRFRDLIRGVTPHSKYILLALAHLTINEPESAFRTTRIYDVYEGICKDESSDPVGSRRVHDLLNELAFLDVIEQRRVTGGREVGTYTQHELLEDAKIVRDVLTESVA